MGPGGFENFVRFSIVRDRAVTGSRPGGTYTWRVAMDGYRDPQPALQMSVAGS